MRWDGKGLPFIEEGDDFQECARWLAPRYRGEFSLHRQISPESVESSILAGFMPMAMRLPFGAGLLPCLTPKLHEGRCLLDPGLTRISRTARRESARFTLSLNRAFRPVLEACVAEHGDDWLLPELADALAGLHGERRARRVALLSVELWEGAGEGSGLVAGEVGYLAGSAYASLSGFKKVSGAGTVQLAALGSLLFRAGIRLWDLGMPLAYKLRLGGLILPRAEFLPALWQAYAEKDGVSWSFLREATEPESARSLIDGGQARRLADPPTLP